MNFLTGRGALVAGAIAIAGLAGQAVAQPAPPPAAASDQAGAPQRHHFDPAQMRARMAEHLRAVLQLQPSQDAALDAYLDALKPPQGLRERHDRDMAAAKPLTTPERLDKMAARMDERRARFNQIAAATKQFYAQLSPAQQKAFDALPFGRGRGARWGRGPHRGGPGGMGGHEMGPGGPPQG